jgi:hypothetical protein
MGRHSTENDKEHLENDFHICLILVSATLFCMVVVALGAIAGLLLDLIDVQALKAEKLHYWANRKSFS